MSRLCRLKTASHGDDGKWAYNEIVSLRKKYDELLAASRLVISNLNGLAYATKRYCLSKSSSAT